MLSSLGRYYLSHSNSSEGMTVIVKHIPATEAVRIRAEYVSNYAAGRRMEHDPASGITGFNDATAECIVESAPGILSLLNCTGIAGQSYFEFLMMSSQQKNPFTKEMAISLYKRLAAKLNATPLATLSVEKLATYEPNGRARFEKMDDGNIKKIDPGVRFR